MKVLLARLLRLRRLAVLAGLFLFCLSAPAVTIPYWIAPCRPQVSDCRPSDPELARWAVEAWQAAVGRDFHLELARAPEQARILVHWAGGAEGMYGETRSITVHGKPAAEVFIVPTSVPPGSPDILLRDAIVYLTCLHEIGHALGLPHTTDFADIMYNFQFGGDIAEYFGRYRRLLHRREDIRKHPGMSAEDRHRVKEIYR